MVLVLTFKAARRFLHRINQRGWGGGACAVIGSGLSRGGDSGRGLRGLECGGGLLVHRIFRCLVLFLVRVFFFAQCGRPAPFSQNPQVSETEVLSEVSEMFSEASEPLRTLLTAGGRSAKNHAAPRLWENPCLRRPAATTATELCATGSQSAPCQLGRQLTLKFTGADRPELDRIEFQYREGSPPSYCQRGEPEHNFAWDVVSDALALLFLDLPLL